MLPENNDFEVNNPTPAPIPEPLPEMKEERLEGGFSGAVNRFCSNEQPDPVYNMPNFSIGNSADNHTSSPKKENTENFGNAFNNHVSQDIRQNNLGAASETETIGKFTVPNQKKKSRTGVVIFISLLTAILILAGIFFGTELLNGKNKTGNFLANLVPKEETPDIQGSDTPPDYDSFFEEIQRSSKVSVNDSKSEDVSKYTNKNWKGVILESRPTKKSNYSAQYSFEKVSPSTVAVLCYTEEADESKTPDGQGTGIIISSDGYIVTNSHVVGDSRDMYNYLILDEKGKKYAARVVGFDTRTDIAVLKINAKNLKPVSFAGISEIQIGDDIIAVGNPGGIKFQNSLTKGIISAKNRILPNSSVEYIQTDAAINPGNSGGPLCNLYGQVVGITTAKINSSMYEGMGFAIPADTVKLIADNIIRNGYVKDRAKIGIVGTAISEYVSEIYNVPTGIMITEIDRDSYLNKTKVRPKDIITKINDTDVKSFGDIYTELEKHSTGDKISITVFRPDNSKGQTFTLEIKLSSE